LNITYKRMTTLTETTGLKRHLISAAHTFLSNFVPVLLTSLSILPLEEWTLSALFSITVASVVTALRGLLKIGHESVSKKEF